MRGYWHNPFERTPQSPMHHPQPVDDVQDIVDRALAVLEPESASFVDDCRRRAADRARVRDLTAGEHLPGRPSVSRNSN